MNLEKDTLIGRYKIVELIGTGGMAKVYRAIDQELERDVTFKVLKKEFISDNEFVKRFRVEAKAAAKLSHSNIASVYDVGDDGDIYYIVMEYIDGCTLKKLIVNKAPFSNAEVIGIAIQIAEALEHAHNHNIVHRDIKPENILITKDGQAGSVKVMDFGIARTVSNNTTSADAMGSVHYFSPEQARGMYVDGRSDIYSLGIVMYEMITGKIPYEGDNAVALAFKHINEPLPDIKTLNPKAYDSVIKIIKKATEKQAADRYQTATELIADLRLAMGDKTGSFVKKAVISDGQTKKLSPEELELIRKNTSNLPKVDVTALVDEKYDDDELADDDYMENQEDFEEKKKERNVVLAAVALSLLVMALLTFGGWIVYDSVINPTVKVPNFEGLTSEEADTLAANKDVFIKKEMVIDNSVEAGVVISQNISAGTKIPETDRVTLTISLGAETVDMPSVVGQSYEEARAMLEEQKIVIDSVEYVTSDDVAVGYVINQSPKAGKAVGKDDKVLLTVSKGYENETVVVPDLLNKTKEEAEKMLKDFEIKYIEDFSATYEKGKIASQGIEKGTTVPKGYTITLTLSKGKDPSLTTVDSTTESTTAFVSSVIEPAKRSVSIPVCPTNLEEFAGEKKADAEGNLVPVVYEVKVVAKSDNGERVISEQKCSDGDFPFSVNDRIDCDTVYSVYINGKSFLEQKITY